MSKRMCMLVGVLLLSLPVGGLVLDAAATTKDTVTLRALFPTTGQQGWQILVDNFQRVFPSIKIDVQFLPSDQLTQLVLTQLQAGNAPDLMFLNNGNFLPNSVLGLGAQGRLLDLSKRPWVRRILPSEKPYVTYRGTVYAWPLVLGPFAVVYNTDLFTQLHLKVPTRFSDVLSMCRQITSAGKIPFVQAWGSVTAGSIVGRQRYEQYVYSVDPKWNQKRAAHQVTFASSPLWHRALQSIIDMKDANCFQPGATGTSRPQQYALFAQGQAVMSIVAAGEVTNIKTINPNLKIAWMNLPPDNPKDSVLVAPYSFNIGANAATKYPAQAASFIDFMAREQQSTLFAKVTTSIAPLDAKKLKLPPEMKGLLPYFKSGKIVPGDDYLWPNPRVYSEGFQTGVVGLITGQLTIDAVLAKMDDLWDNG
jgi:raffinose/stachyose/melibiose transport system substrate-binding protein